MCAASEGPYGSRAMALAALVLAMIARGHAYQLPESWPSGDQTLMIDEPFLSDPMVTEAMMQVRAKVPQALLDIPPSTYVQYSQVQYHANPTDTCYWPSDLCTRTVDSEHWKADIFVCPGSNTWGLTYDDGPSENIVDGVHTQDTNALRGALKGAALKATFFVVGSNVREFQDEARALFEDGHQIAVHTWTHHPLTSLTNEQVVAEIKYTEAAIYQAAGVVPRYLRPPYGDIDDRIRAIAAALGYRVVMWTTNPNRDSEDAVGLGSGRTTSDILSFVQSWFYPQPGFVSLQHDVNPGVVDAALKVVEAIKKARDDGTFPLAVMPVAACVHDAAPYSTPPSGPTGSPTGTVVGTFTAAPWTNSTSGHESRVLGSLISALIVSSCVMLLATV